MIENKRLSIVVPAYNEGLIINQTANRILKVMETISCTFQLIFVDDGSSDDTWLKITLIAQDNPNVVGLKLSRNFGKEGAILAGLSNANGDAVILIDCDLQHPPEFIPEMYRIWIEKGVDVVEGIKFRRCNEHMIYKYLANIFYFLLNKVGNINLKDSSDFQLIDRKVVDIIVNLPERQRFFRALSSWTGFKRSKIYFQVEARQNGYTKWNAYKLFKYAVMNITSFSTFPLQIVTLSGFLFFIIAVVMGIHTLYMYLAHNAVEGFTTVILLLLIIGAMLMISLGLLGLYVAKIYEEVKRRPIYLVESIVKSEVVSEGVD